MASIMHSVSTPSSPGQEIVVHAIGDGEIPKAVCHVGNKTPCWVMLRHVAGEESGVKDQIVTIACRGAEAYDDSMQATSCAVLELLGKADITVCVDTGSEMFSQIQGLTCSPKGNDYLPEAPEGKATCNNVLKALTSTSSSYNWILIDPANLDLHQAGFAGLEELKGALQEDKVLFGALRFTFPREFDGPPIVKFLFIHWIGTKVSVVKRGQWNSKLDTAFEKVRKHFDCAFRKTVYSKDDLDIEQLVAELSRVTCVTSSDTRQLSLEWYNEGLQPARQHAADYDSAAASTCCDSEDSEDISPDVECEFPKPFLRKSAAEAIAVVREHGRHWTWVLLTTADRTSPVSKAA